MNNTPGQEKKSEDLAFENVKVFTLQDYILGLPSVVFLAGGALSLALSILAFWWAGVLFAVIYFPPMYYIHEDDPRGFQAWKRGVTTCDYFCAGQAKSLSIVIVSRKL